MDSRAILAGLLVALAVIGLTGFVVNRPRRGTTPAVIAAVLMAVAAVLAAVPADHRGGMSAGR